MRKRLDCQKGKHDWVNLANGQQRCFHCEATQESGRLTIDQAEAMSIGKDVKQGKGRQQPKWWPIFSASFDKSKKKKKK
jgi:hypothetical protein